MKIPSNQDPFGQAITDYHANPSLHKMIRVESNLTENETIPVSWLFRSFSEMPSIETTALALSSGKVLDLGAGSGVHALVLQENNLEVTATDVSSLAVDVMQKKGVKRAFCADLLDFEPEPFDTVLMLMNGIGVVGSLDGLHDFLEKVKKYLHPKGQILCDSSDILYMYEQEDGSITLDLNASYYGEMNYKCTYQKTEGAWFDWLYIDPMTLSEIAKEHGFESEIIIQTEQRSYLARLVLIE